MLSYPFAVCLAGPPSFELGDDRFSSASSDSSQSSLKFSLTSKRRHDASLREKSHRSKASVAARKRGLEDLDGLMDVETTPSSKDLKIDALQEYSWKGSRKKVLLQLFMTIWKRLCEKESVQFSEKLEENIREDVGTAFVPYS